MNQNQNVNSRGETATTITAERQYILPCTLFFLDSMKVRLGVHDPMWHLYITVLLSIRLPSNYKKLNS